MCNIESTIKTTANVLKDIPKVYDEGLSPIVKPTSKTLGLIPRTIKACLAPLEKWILNCEYSVKETELLLEEKLSNRNPKNIVSPEAYVAVPAIQGISYCANSTALRNLYSNLLANSMDKEIKDQVHPAFVEIIKQLSPLEAKILKKFSLLDSYVYPIYKIRIQEDELNSTGSDICLHILSNTQFDIDCQNKNYYSISIDNLIRLHLVTVNYGFELADKSNYDDFENSDIFAEYKKYHRKIVKKENIPLKYICFNRGILQITDFGKSFIKICVE